MTKGRVKNATSVDKYGIHFRSKLECYTYEAFMKAGIPVKYEPKHLPYCQNLNTLVKKFVQLHIYPISSEKDL